MSHQHLIDSKSKIILLILILGGVTIIGPLTIDMYLPAFSEIARSFDAPKSLMQLSLTTYFVGMALSQLLYGPIIDRYGRKLPLFCGLIIFIIASLACSFAQNIDQLIILRFFQAVGACAGMVIPRTIVRDIFTPQESARVFSHLMLVMGIAPILAPLLGSALLIKFSWQAIFIFLAIFGIFCLLLGHFSVPETKGPNPDDKISNALKKYFGILHDRTFVVCSLSGGLTMAGLFSFITGSPFIYIELFQLSAKSYSILFASSAISFIIAAQINARLLKKFSIEEVVGKILLLPAIAGIALILIGTNDPEFWPLTLTLFLFLASIGAIVPSTSALALSNHAVHAGSASALLGTVQFTLAAIASILINKLHDGTAVPMSLVIGICGISACLIYRIFYRKKTI